MTKERALFLKSKETIQGLPFSFDHEFNKGKDIFEYGITPEEDEYIKLVWSMMSDDSSYYDALCAIAEG